MPLPVFPRRLRTFDLNPMMVPPRELDIKGMVGAPTSTTFVTKTTDIQIKRFVVKAFDLEFSINLSR